MKLRNFKFAFFLPFVLLVVHSTNGYAPPSPNLLGEAATIEQRPSSTGGVLVIQLRAGGFAPREIVRPAGHYLVLVNNVSGIPDVTLRLKREGDQTTYQTTLKRGISWRQHARLVPGVYLLTEANHPDWVCRVTVTSN